MEAIQLTTAFQIILDFFKLDKYQVNMVTYEVRRDLLSVCGQNKVQMLIYPRLHDYPKPPSWRRSGMLHNADYNPSRNFRPIRGVCIDVER